MKITGVITRDSWEKQTFFKLSNGYTAIVEYNIHYGEFVKGLDFPDGESIWRASDGLDPVYHLDDCEIVRKVFIHHKACPDFARAWREEKTGLIRPSFERVWKGGK